MKWEYKTFETLNHKTFAAEANDHGKDGWELIHVDRSNNITLGFFKRPLEGNGSEK